MQIYGMNSKRIEELLPIYNEWLYLPSQREMPQEAPVMGNYEKKVLVVIPKEDVKEEFITFLQKMLGACRLQPADYFIVSHNSTQALPELITHYQPETVLLFGITWSSAYFTMGKKTYVPFRFHRQKWLLSDSLPMLNSNPALKLQLWTGGLKPLFGIE